jgi:hypothetical protein
MRRVWRSSGVLWGLLMVGASLVPTLAAGADAAGGRASPVVGNEARISGNGATSYEERADVAWNSTTNQYLVVWSDGRDAGTKGSEVYARMVGADGKPVGGEKLISGPGAVSDDRCPAVAWGAATK